MKIYYSRIGANLNDLKFLRYLNYGYYCEEIWDAMLNHPLNLPPDLDDDGATGEYV